MAVRSSVQARKSMRTAIVMVAAAALLPAAAPAGAAAPAPAAPAAAPTPINLGLVDDYAKFTEDDNTAIAAHAKALIDAAPSGANLRLPLYYFTQQSIVDALKNARIRGVKVKVVINGSEIGMPQYKSLTAPFEPSPGAAKIKLDVVTCGKRVQDAAGGFPTQSGRYISDRGCIADRQRGDHYSRMHNKFMTIDKVELSGGGIAQNVVYVASANLHEWTSYESVITVRDQELHAFYAKYFDDMYALATGNLEEDNHNYGKTRKTADGKYELYTFPRKEADGQTFASGSRDPVVAKIKAAECSPGTTTDVINVANARFAREPVADALIAAGKRGCTVRVVTGDTRYKDEEETDRTYEAVRKLAESQYITGGVKVCGPENGIAWMHEKFMQIGGGTSAGLYVGSHNLTYQALRQQDENILRMVDSPLNAGYTQRFERLHAYCWPVLLTPEILSGGAEAAAPEEVQ